jgi:ABC-type multidrug transport system fused ATPase/permease subunit
MTAVAIGISYGSLSPVLGTLVVTAIFRLGGVINWLTWAYSNLFETIGHASRVFDYVDLPPEEQEERNKDAIPLADNPLPQSPPLVANGASLRFDNYSMSYRVNTPLIFQDLSFSIEAGQRVGLIGRTGSGKTSIVQSLYRMVYVHGGDIFVGNRSLLSLPVREARKLFAVVPQDPYLFEGTVRSNLDRYNDYTVEALVGVMKNVGLTMSLDMALIEGGRNLSLGERQLLCLARVILTDCPFIIMDEPTSGVDTITDAMIHRVLQEQLKGKTILTIAHRLESLRDFDRIIEMREGRIVNDGTPQDIIPLISEVDIE